ncbi:MAG: hypothetical protein ACKOPS_20550, partial [Cyanobium sp.]
QPATLCPALGLNSAQHRIKCLGRFTLIRQHLGQKEPAEALDQVLARIEALRRPEVSRLQQLQAEETARGRMLLERPWLRRLLGGSAPLLGPAIASRWLHDQRQLRQGVTRLPPAAPCPGHDS